MAQSSIQSTKLKKISGTLTSDTGDYLIRDFLEDNDIPVQAYFLTSYNQYRPVDVGFYGSTLIIQGATETMKNRLFFVLVEGGVISAILSSIVWLTGGRHEQHHPETKFSTCRYRKYSDIGTYVDIKRSMGICKPWKLAKSIWQNRYCVSRNLLLGCEILRSIHRRKCHISDENIIRRGSKWLIHKFKGIFLDSGRVVVA
jgi:hypothetical protein